MNLKKLLKTAEAAEYLGLKKGYLHKLMMRRAIPYYKPGGKNCFFDIADLDAYLMKVRVSSQEELDQQAQAYIANRSFNNKPGVR